MTGQRDVSAANHPASGNWFGVGTTKSAGIRLPLMIPGQSIFMLAASSAFVFVLSMPGLPCAQSVLPVNVMSPLPTVVPATDGICPHSSTPLSNPAVPCFFKPVRLVQAERTCIVLVFHCAY